MSGLPNYCPSSLLQLLLLFLDSILWSHQSTQKSIQQTTLQLLLFYREVQKKMSIICLLQDAKLVSSSLSLLTKDTKVLLPPPFTNVSFWKKVWKPASACLLSQNLICFPRRKIPLVNLKLEKKLFFRLQWVLSFSKCMQIFNQIEAWRMWILTLPKIFLQFFQLRLFLDFLSFFQTLWT